MDWVCTVDVCKKQPLNTLITAFTQRYGLFGPVFRLIGMGKPIASTWIDRSLPETKVPMALAMEAFNRRFVEVVESREVFDLATGDRMTYADFHAAFKHQRHLAGEKTPKAKPATEAWLELYDHPRAFRYTYVPGEDQFVYDCVNLWKNISPKAVPGDITPWTTILDHVFCDLTPEERHWVNCWMAYPFQHPGTKLHTAILMYSSVQGVGKGLITETLKLLYGRHPDDSYSNAGTIGNMQLHSSFNAWIARRQLIVCDEISVQHKDREVIAERLKSFITEHNVTVNQKYAREISLPNYANFIITSNSPAAVKIEDYDRRYFVIGSSAGKIDPLLATSFLHWRDANPDPEDENAPTPGLNALMHHFLTYDTTGFNPYAAAPHTASKSEVVENGSSIQDGWLRNFKSNMESYPDLVTVQELYDVFEKEHPNSLVGISSFSTAMTRQGFIQASSEAISIGDGKRVRLRILKNHEQYKGISDADKGKAYKIQRMSYKPVSFATLDMSEVRA
jgi:hypothetical protein